EEGREYPLSGFRSYRLTASGDGLLLVTTLFDDAGSPGYLRLDEGSAMQPVSVEGVVHEGAGELEQLKHLEGDRFAAIYSIDGCSWAYDSRFDEPARTLRLER